MATFSANKFGVNQPPYDNEALKAGFDKARIVDLEDLARQAQSTLREAWMLLQALAQHRSDDEKVKEILASEMFGSAMYRVRTALSRAALMNLEKT